MITNKIVSLTTVTTRFQVHFKRRGRILFGPACNKINIGNLIREIKGNVYCYTVGVVTERLAELLRLTGSMSAWVKYLHYL